MDSDYLKNLKYSPTQWRYSERLFRRYEPVFVQVYKLHTPEVNPTKSLHVQIPGSVSTHRSRIYDAVNSLRANRWDVPFNLDQFLELWNFLTIRIQDKQIYICPRAMPTGELKFNQPQKTELLANNPTELELRALLVVQSFQTFGDKVVQVTDCSKELQEKLPLLIKEFPNVVVDYPIADDRSNFILI